MQECGGGAALGDSDAIPASVMCGAPATHGSKALWPTPTTLWKQMKPDTRVDADGAAGVRLHDGCLSFCNIYVPARWPLSASCCLPHLQMYAN